MTKELSVPETWVNATQEVSRHFFGKLKRPLAEMVAIVSESYTRDRAQLYRTASTSSEGLSARLRFFLPRDLHKSFVPVSELLRAGCLPSNRPWRVLDLGAGLGTTTFGAARAAFRAGVPNMNVDAWEEVPQALAIFEALAKRNVDLGMCPIQLDKRSGRFDAADLERLPDGEYDLILLGLVLNELPFEERVRWTKNLVTKLRPEGAIVILEPALKEITRDLHRLRDHMVADGSHVFAPCVHENPCPMLTGERDWCHEDLDFVLPPTLKEVAKAASLRFERLTFSYLTLRRESSPTLRNFAGENARRVVSMPLVSKGKRELYLCGQQGIELCRRLDRDSSKANAAFGSACRGDLLVMDAEQGKVKADTPVDSSPRLL